MVLLALLATPAILYLLLALLIHLERRSPLINCGVLLGLLLTEAILYPDQGAVTSSIFLPAFGGQDVRLPQVFIPLALLARHIVRPSKGRYTTTSLLWGLFFVWYTTEFVLGLMGGNNTIITLFQAKAIIYAGGSMLLFSGLRGASIAKVIASTTTLPRWIKVAGAAALFNGICSLAGLKFGLRIPLLRLDEIGLMHSNTASYCLAFGTIMMLLLLAQQRRRPLLIVMAAGAILAPLFVVKRAPLLSLAATAVCLVVLMFARQWPRRFYVKTGAVLTTMFFALAAVVSVIAMITIVTQTSPLQGRVLELFHNQERQESEAKRVELWHDSQVLIRKRPIEGYGLGKQIIAPKSPGLPEVGFEPHNLVYEMLLRGGVVALLLLFGALASTARDALRLWRHHADRRVAALAAGTLIVIAGLLTRAMVEPLLEDFKLACLFGVLVGFLMALDGTTREDLDTATGLLATSAAPPAPLHANGRLP